MHRLLIANRGEIAIRIARTAEEMGIVPVAVHARDDRDAPHVRRAEQAVELPGDGPAAYLDVAAVVEAARAAGCDALHPGYGFLSENSGLARACAGAGLAFVGPSPETLELFGDKARARRLAVEAGVPVARGTDGPTSLDEALAFLAGTPGGKVMVKAVAGGGGRGMRVAASKDELAAAYERCASEAITAFGSGDLYVEELQDAVRHVEVQLAGDGDRVVHLFDRECSLQRNRQKVVEVAPAVAVDEEVRARLFSAAVAVGEAASVRGLTTVEFLVRGDGSFVFLEANPRLQVEHTVTEEVLGLDLVRLQLDVTRGGSLPDVSRPAGVAVQARINLERPGTITTWEPPSGPGVRVDGAASAGYRPNPRFDPLLAKVVVHARTGGLATAVAKAARAVGELRVEGVETNAAFLVALLEDERVERGDVDTEFLERNAAALSARARSGLAGASVDADDPLAVLHHGRIDVAATAPDSPSTNDDEQSAVRAPMQGTVVEFTVSVGDAVAAGQPVAVMEAMKMEHLVTARIAGVVTALTAETGEAVLEGHPLVVLEPAAVGDAAAFEEQEPDPAHVRDDLREVIDRHERVLDSARPDAVDRRRRLGRRTARENVEDLCDPGSFTEYGPLVVAARRRRNTVEELIAQTPADGLVMGLGTVNGERVAVMAYDYTVLAGTQGANNHLKLDRMAELAYRWRLPTIFFTEGGGGRPGDTEGGGFIRGFELWGKLSGAVPLVGVTSGRCFAGNAAILGCCDVIIATKDSALGMGGPAMVEGGGLGVFRPEEIGPVPVMTRNGVIDVLVDDEAEAVAAAKKYLSYFQGASDGWSCADQRRLRHVVPENRVRAYDVRKVIDLLADTGSVLELRPEFGVAMITALARIEGHPVGVIANNPMHLGGAIDSDASDKAARFLQICEAFDLPVVSLSDTPGNMVGPEAEKTGLIRHCSRLFVIGANLTVPIFSVILRKSYGLGAIAMTGGSYQAAMFCVSWPTGEFGGMGLEGSVKLGYRNELAAIEDPAERRATFDRMVAAAYAAGKALSRGMSPALDDVIDPADTRRWIVAGLRSLPPVPPRTGKKVPWIDAW